MSDRLDRVRTHRRRAEQREYSLEAERLELMFKLMLGAALLVFGGLLFESYRSAEEEGAEDALLARFGAITGIVVCASMFVPWSRLPFLRERVRRPSPFMAVVTKLLLAITLGSLPFLVFNGELPVALGAAGLAVVSAGLWLRWSWAVWVWYLILLGQLVAMLRVVLTEVRDASLDLRSAIDLVQFGFVALMWLVVVFELVGWHREQRAEARALRTAAPAPTPTPAVDPGPPPAAPEESSEQDA